MIKLVKIIIVILNTKKHYKTTMHTVYVNKPDHFFFYNVKMTADYCNFPMETVFVNKETEESKEFKAKKAWRKFPFMETPQGVLIAESSAISAYIARVSNR